MAYFIFSISNSQAVLTRFPPVNSPNSRYFHQQPPSFRIPAQKISHCNLVIRRCLAHLVIGYWLLILYNLSMSLRSYLLVPSSYFSALAARLNRRDLPLLPKLSRLQKSLFVISCFFIFTLFTVYNSRFTKQTIAAEKSEIRYQRDAIKIGGNVEGWFGSSLFTTIFHLLNILTNIIDIPDDVLTSVETGQPIASSRWVPGGSIGVVSTSVASLYSPPASGVEYIAKIKDNFLGKPAYAQGVGFAGLQPLLPLWRGFRNIVYLLSSIVFIAIGMMIILRVKISPQAVVTIQNAIPSLITTLILVTFSYAIAGLIIDLTYLLSSFVFVLIFSIKNVSFDENLLNFRAATGVGVLNPLAWLNGFTRAAAERVIPELRPYTLSHLTNPNWATAMSLAFHALPSWALFSLSGMIGSTVLGTLGGGIMHILAEQNGTGVGRWAFGAAGGIVGGTVGGILFALIISIIVIFWLIKLYFGLLKTYVTVIFKIVIAPLEIGLGAFPQSKNGFSSWFFDLVGYISVFPVTCIFLVLINYLSETVGNSTSLWFPNIISPGLASTNAIIKAGFGLAGLGLVSKMPEMIPQFIFSLKPSPWTQAINQAYGPGKTFDTIKASALGAGAEKGYKFLFNPRPGAGPIDPATGVATDLDPRIKSPFLASAASTAVDRIKKG
jgi:hypothetical protein